MVQSVKATYRDGVLEPSESLDLEDGDVVTLSISEVNGAGDGEETESAFVSGNGVADTADRRGRVGNGSRKRGTFGASHDTRNPRIDTRFSVG